MKRQLPRVLSSFRSSKRRIHQQKTQVTIISDDCETSEIARSSHDNYYSLSPSPPLRNYRCCKEQDDTTFLRQDENESDVSHERSLFDDVMQECQNVEYINLSPTNQKYVEDFESDSLIFLNLNDSSNSSMRYSQSKNQEFKSNTARKFVRNSSLRSSFAGRRQNELRQGVRPSHHQHADEQTRKSFCSPHPSISTCASITSNSSSFSSSFDGDSANTIVAYAGENCDHTNDGSNHMTVVGTTPVHAIPSTSSENGVGTKFNYILEELLNTEESYVKELESLVEFYVKPFEAIENSTLIPANLRGQSDVIFGNLRDLTDFHRRFVLSEFQRCADSVGDICRVLVNQRNNFLALYRPYCQNKPLSEALRGSTDTHPPGTAANGCGEQCKFFAECQRRAGHLLPLGAYLLKPIQRITKYQLLLKELLRCCATDNNRREVEAALAAMLDLLAQLNADMQQLHILGFAGDLRLFGPLRLQTECEVYAFKRKSRRLANKPQRRHIFLFDGGILFCKKRTQNLQYASEYYEHKLCIPIHNLGFAECSKWSPDRFELWDESRNDGYAIKISDEDEKLRAKWIARLARLTTLFAQQQRQQQQQQHQQQLNLEANVLHQRRHSSYFANSGGYCNNTAQQQWQYQQQQQQQLLSQHQRPQSWTSEGSCSMSSRSSASTHDEGVIISEGFAIADSNGNPSPTTPSNSFFTRKRLSSLINSGAFVTTAPISPSTTTSATSHTEFPLPDGDNNIPTTVLTTNHSSFSTVLPTNDCSSVCGQKFLSSASSLNSMNAVTTNTVDVNGVNHVTSIQIPASKSLQNTTQNDTNDLNSSRHAASFQQLGTIVESARRHSKSATPLTTATANSNSMTSVLSHTNNNNKTELIAK